MPRSTVLIAAALALALAAPAHAATIELRAGAVTAAAGQYGRIALSNTGTSSCIIRNATFLIGPVAEDGGVRLMPMPVNIGAGVLLPNTGLVGIWSPEIVPELVQGQAVIECRGLTATQVRSTVHLTLELAASRFGAAQVVVQGQ